MNLKDYQQEAKRTLPHISDIPATENYLDILHMVIGISTEAGELSDAFKKNLAYGKELDWVNVGEEIGDILWYIANFCTLAGLDLEQIMQVNIDKLRARYPEKFDSKLALERTLDKEREILNELGYTNPQK